MKKKLIAFVGLYLIVIISTLFIIQAFYNTNISDFKQDYTITSLNFSVNGISAKHVNDGEDESVNIHTIDLTDIDLDHNDGFSVDMELGARGTSNGSYAIDYTITATSSDTEGAITPYIMVMQKINGEYVFISYLNDFLENDLTGLVGLNENKTYNYIFTVVPNTNIDLSSEVLDLSFDATYNIDVSQDKLSDYPYYYLSNSYETTEDGSSGTSIFSKLVNKQTELEGKTIVLTSDFYDFSLNEDIVLPFKVGIDLNGHTIDLNGGSITIMPTGEIDDEVYIKDTNGGGSILNGNIYIDSSNDVIKVSDELLDTSESDLYSNIIVTNSSVSKFNAIMKEQISEFSLTPLVGETDEDITVNVDFTEGIKFYLEKGYFSVDVKEDDTSITATSVGVYPFDREEITHNHHIFVTTTNVSTSNTSELNGSIYTLGNGVEDIGESLLTKVPDEISTSIFLPSYDLSTNTEYYWTSDNQDLLDKDGQYLKNGLSALSTYKNQEVTLQLVAEKDGERVVYGKTVTIVIFSLEDRIDMLSVSHQILLSTTGVNVDGVGVFDINDIIKLNNLINDDDSYLTYMEDTYNIVPIGDTTSDKINYVDSQFAEKIGLVSIDIPDVSDVGASQLNIDNSDSLYYLTDPDNSSGLNSYYIYAVENENDGYDSFTLNVQKLPNNSIKLLSFETSYQFYLNEADTETTEISSPILSEIQLQPAASQNQAVDPFSELMTPFNQFDSDMNSSYEEVSRTNSVTGIDYDLNKYFYLDDDLNKVYEYKTSISLESDIEDYNPNYEIVSIGGVAIADYSSDVPIVLSSSTTDSEGNDYTNDNGDIISKYQLDILPGYVPNTDTEIVIKATLDTGNGDPKEYDLVFTMPGIVSNTSDGVSDSNLYYELLDSGDANNDGYLTTNEAKQLEDVTFSGSSTKTITTLNGIDVFNNLKNVKLNDNSIINTSLLSELKNLETLNVSGNNIVQLESLSNLDSITDLNVSNNKIVSLKPITYLTNLEYLDISTNSISNFEFISNYSNLKELYVYENPGASEATSEYYFAKIYNNSDTIQTEVYRTDASTYMVFADDAVTVTKILDSIQIAIETFGNLSLPHEITKTINSVETQFEIVYSSTDTSENIISFTDTAPYYLYTSPSVDTEITIFVQAKDVTSGTIYSQTMQFPISMLKATNPQEYIYLETSSGVFELLSDVVPDSNLRTILYNTYNDASDTTTYLHSYNSGANTYLYGVENVISLTERTTVLEPDLEDNGITDLTGINYFSFTKLNISNNTIDSLEPLISISELDTLTLGGQSYNFDELAGIGTVTTKNMILTNLYLSGTFNLEDEDTLTSLYHVYKNNSTDTLSSDSYVNIYLSEDLTTPWNPFYDQLQLQAAAYQQSYYLYDLGQSISIDKSVSFRFYDDDYDTVFRIDTFGVDSDTGIDTDVDSYLSGHYAAKIDIVDNSVDDTFDLYLNYLPGYAGELLYSINFTNATQVDASTTYNFQSNYKITSPIHIEYNDTYYVMYSENGETEVETKISDIFKGELLRDLAMTAIGYVDPVNITTSSDGIGYLLDSTYLSTTLGTITSDDTHLLVINGDSNKLDFDGDGENGIEGLRYFTKILKISAIDDVSLQTGKDLVNLTVMYIRYAVVDFSTITVDIPNLATLVIVSPLNLNLYDTDLYASTDTSLFNDPNYYYLNRLTAIKKLYIYRGNTYSPQIYDFRGLRGVIGDENKNNITNIKLYGLLGSQYASTKSILDSIYSNSLNEPEFIIANSTGTNGVQVAYLPDTAVVDDNAAAIAEYNELYEDIVDYGAEVKVSGETMYHYQDPLQMYDGTNGDSITLPGYIKNFGGDIDGDGFVDIDKDKDADSDDIVYKLDEDGNEYLDGSSTIQELNEVRRINVSWYVYTRDIVALETILGITSSDYEEVVISGLNEKGLYKYKLNNLSNVYSLEDTVFSFVSPLYDTTFLFQGIIGDAVNNNSDLASDLTARRSTLYPVTVKGTAAYTSTDNNRYEYLINGETYYSYRTFSEIEFRLSVWIAFSYKDLAQSSLTTYYSGLGTSASTYGLISKQRSDAVTTILTKGSSEGTISSAGYISGYYLNLYFSVDSVDSQGVKAYLNNSINNLDGIGIFSNLVDLQVGDTQASYTQLEDISFLQYLPKLETLKIIGGSFHDLSPIKNCPLLTSIVLTYNEFETTYEEVGGEYVSYFSEMNNLDNLTLSYCVGVTYIDLLALIGNLDPNEIDKYDNTSWVTVDEVGSTYTATINPNLFITGESNNILSSGDFLDFSYTESSYFVSNYLAMYFLYDTLASDTDYFKTSWTNTTTVEEYSKASFNTSFNTVLEAYYKSAYTIIANGSSFNLGTISPELMLPDMGSFSIDGELTGLDDAFKVLPGAFNVPVKYEIPVDSTTSTTYYFDLYLDYNYYLSASGNTDNIYLYYTDSSNNEMTIDTNGDPVPYVIGATNRADLRTIFGPTILEFLLINNLSKVSQEVVGGQTYIFDVTDITSVYINGDSNFIHSIEGLQYLPGLTYFTNKYNPIVEMPYFSSSFNGSSITTFNLSDEWAGINYKYYDIADLANLRDLVNLETFKAVHLTGDFTENFEGESYSFKDCLTYIFQNLETVYSAQNGMYYAYNADNTVNEEGTYEIINRMLTDSDYFTLFGVDTTKEIDGVTYTANLVTSMSIHIKPYAEVSYTDYAMSGPISKNFIIATAYMLAVRYSNTIFEPFAYTRLYKYDSFISARASSAKMLVFNYISMMNSDQKVDGTVISSDRVLLYYKFEEGSVYFLPQQEYFYGHWVDLRYSADQSITEPMAQVYGSYGVRDTLIIPMLETDGVAINFKLTVKWPNNRTLNTNNKTQIVPATVIENPVIDETDNYYVEVNQSETEATTEAAKYPDFITSLDGTRYFVRASEIYGSGNILFYIFYGEEVALSYNENAAKVFYHDYNHTASYANTNKDGSIDLTGGSTLDNKNLFSLAEQESITGFYNKGVRYDKFVASLQGFERFINLTEFYNYRVGSTNYLQVTTFDLTPLKDLSLTQFYVSGNLRMTTNDLLPLLEGSKDTLLGFSYLTINNELAMFDLNLLLGFTNLKFCYINDSDITNYTNSLSFRNFTSYLYLYRNDLYNHFYIEDELFPSMPDLHDYGSSTWDYGDFSTNADIFGADLVNAEILNNLEIGDLVSNDFAYIDLSESDTLELPTSISRGGVEYSISIESNSAFLSVNGNTLTVVNRGYSPGYGFIKVRLLDSTAKITTEAERIIYIKL